MAQAMKVKVKASEKLFAFPRKVADLVLWPFPVENQVRPENPAEYSHDYMKQSQWVPADKSCGTCGLRCISLCREIYRYSTRQRVCDGIWFIW